MRYAPLNIPLHGKGTAMDKLSLHANMASLNPDGFRASSTKKDRKRVNGRAAARKLRGRPRFFTRAEQLAARLEDA